MLTFAFWLITLAAAIGLFLAVRALGAGALPAGLPALHGVVAVAGLGALALAAAAGRGSPDRYGTASFGPAAAILGALAAVIGLKMLVRRRSGRGVGFLIGVHATVAMIAYSLLLAYVWLA